MARQPTCITVVSVYHIIIILLLTSLSKDFKNLKNLVCKMFSIIHLGGNELHHKLYSANFFDTSGFVMQRLQPHINFVDLLSVDLSIAGSGFRKSLFSYRGYKV